LNGTLLSSGLIDDIYIPPPAYDAGTSWGAALKVFFDAHPEADRDRAPSPFMGPSFTVEEMETALTEAKIPFSRPDDLPRAAASHLAAGRIVARFDGRMEIGPRALGHRSILADPRPEGMKDHLNARVKHRESFRPFGPSVLAGRASELFQTGGAASPHMLLTFKLQKNWEGRIPAVTHVDNSARIQTVDARDDPDYHALLTAFDEATGVPCVLNTSFNVMGEPIVNTPAGDLDCFQKTGIDVCVLGPFLARKDG